MAPIAASFGLVCSVAWFARKLFCAEHPFDDFMTESLGIRTASEFRATNRVGMDPSLPNWRLSFKTASNVPDRVTVIFLTCEVSQR